jgi:hypothetical protein
LPAFTCRKMRILTTKDARIEADPTKPIADFDKDFLPSPLIRKPTSGKSGTSQMSCSILFIKAVCKA